MKKIKNIRRAFFVVYLGVLAIFVFFVFMIPKQSEQRERDYIHESEKALSNAMQNNLEDGSKTVEKLVAKYPMELVILKGNDIVYNTTSLETIKPILLKEYVNKEVVLMEKQGKVETDQGSYSFWYTLYRMTDEATIMGNYYMWVVVFTLILFTILLMFIAYIQYAFYRPMRNLKESLEKVSDNNFSEVKPLEDELNKSFKDFSTRVDSFSKNVLHDYTKQEQELVNARHIIKDNLFYSRAMIHDLKTPVHEMLLGNEHEVSKAEHAKSKEILDFNVKQSDMILKKLNNVLVSLNTDVSYYKQEIETFDIVTLFDEQLKKFGVSLRQRNLFFDLHQPEALMMTSNRASLELLIHNILSNAVQYALDDSEVYISIDKVGPVYTLVCENDTLDEHVERLQKKNQFFNVYSKQERNYHSGNGLYFIEELAKLLGGTYQLQVDGTRIKVAIQLKEFQDEAVA